MKDKSIEEMVKDIWDVFQLAKTGTSTLNPDNILPLQPNTISVGGCDKIVLSPKGLEIEIDVKIDNFDKFEFIEINGKRFKRVRD